MRIALLGATGQTGQACLAEALDRGHEVVAISRHPESLTPAAGMQAVAADVTDASSLTGPLSGCDAVIFCVGVSNPMQARKGTQVYSVGAKNTASAMERDGLKRVIAVSSAGVAYRRGAPLLYKLIVKPYFLEPAYRDMRLMESFLADSDLDWTIVRPPQLVNRPLRTDYRLSSGRNFEGDHALPKASLAHFLVSEAEAPRFERQIVAISM